MLKTQSTRLRTSLLVLSLAAAVRADDRLGSLSSSIPIIRRGDVNTISVSLGTPEQQLELALTTAVDYFAVVNSSCPDCTSEAPAFNTSGSSSFKPTNVRLLYDFDYPPGRRRVNGNFASDKRVVGEVSDTGSVLVINSVIGEGRGEQAQMTAGISGYFGLGVDRDARDRSFIYGATGGEFTAGLDMFPETGRRTVGRLDWGGVNHDRTQGNLEWVKTDTSWSFNFESINVEGGTIDGTRLKATVDPGLNAIFAPWGTASDIYSKVGIGRWHMRDGITRWELPCDRRLSFELQLENDRTFAVPDEKLKIKEGETCYGAIMAWSNFSTPDIGGKISLGTPFLTEWYTALYYVENNVQVGFARYKQDGGGSGPNRQLMGILLGILVPLAVLFLVILYMRNRYFYPRFFEHIYDRHYEHALAVQAAMRAGQPPPHHMPWGYRMFAGVFPPGPREPYFQPGPGFGPPMMGGPPLHPGMAFGSQPQFHPPMAFGPQPLQPGMTGMGSMAGMAGMHPPPMAPHMTGMAPMQPGMTGMPPPMAPQMTGMPPMQQQFTGRPRSAMPYPPEFGGMPPGPPGHGSHGRYHPGGSGSGNSWFQAGQEVTDIFGRQQGMAPSATGQVPMSGHKPAF